MFFDAFASGYQFRIKNGFPELRGDHAHSLLAGAVLVATILLAVDATAQPTDDEVIHVVFKVNGQAVTPSDDGRDELRNQADRIVRHCGYGGGAKQGIS